MKYDSKKFTWGYELEIGDVQRSHSIPPYLGSWEHAETDICNMLGRWWGRASDPLGIDPPVGGEINIMPARSRENLLQRIEELLNWFKTKGDTPTTSCTNVGHIHIHVPGLKEDIEGLKKLTSYILDNQEKAVHACWNYSELPLMKNSKTARTYLKWDGGRLMPRWMGENILNSANNFEDFIRLQCCGKDGISRGRPFRYAINTYCLKHTSTIEFRLFRASLELAEIADSLLFVEEFMKAALDTQESVCSILSRKNFQFPPFTYDHNLYLHWEKSKWNKARGKKERKYYEAT